MQIGMQAYYVNNKVCDDDVSTIHEPPRIIVVIVEGRARRDIDSDAYDV